MSVSFTIDNLSSAVLGRLQVEAQRRGVDVKDVVKEIIEDGITPLAESNSSQTHHDLDALAGTWSAEETEQFLSAVSEMRQCDEELWK